MATCQSWTQKINQQDQPQVTLQALILQVLINFIFIL